MTEGEDKEPNGGRGPQGAAVAAFPRTAETSFDRREMNAILSVYGRKVAAGEWRDYAIDQRSDEAVFSIFRRSSENPLYRIVKKPQARRHGPYAVMAPGGHTLRRGHDLRQVLVVLERELRLVKA